MNGFSRGVAAAGVIILTVTAISSCKKPGDTVKSDLVEAGYKLTPDDWFRASRNNDVSALKKFVAGGFSDKTKDGSGDSALHAAAANGAQGSADFLLNRGLAVDLRGGSERTPLMAAVMGNQTEMTRWLLRQGADPHLKDQEGFKPLMLAVREGSAGSVAELAPYDREDLDPALLLAALVGRADVIDALTNYGASVYARMEDGRTPLMTAAENGHMEAVKLLLEIGSSRYTTDTDGRTAADMATAAGHPEIAALISRDPLPGELALESPAEIAESLDKMVDTAVAKSAATPGPAGSPDKSDAAPKSGARVSSIAIEGQVLSQPVAANPGAPASPAAKSDEPFAMPPLVMRQYREREIPVSIKTVQGDAATLKIAGATPREVKVRAGESIPGSNLVIVRVQRRMEDSKVNPGGHVEISVVQLRDRSTGTTREWISGVPSEAHDPVALVEDAGTGKRYVASPGQRFKGGDGAEYLISDVRPNQLVIQDVSSGAVRTIPLRGPRG
ncbi:MAG: ankyrin repeat domain-containing protein [Luteolibacter sp.]|uniref:ankyrin repeat domain-containing protein n=1 Tax=Luteolibacter sp. TaxID=1962973 RepID=UPI00326376E2